MQKEESKRLQKGKGEKDFGKEKGKRRGRKRRREMKTRKEKEEWSENHHQLSTHLILKGM